MNKTMIAMIAIVTLVIGSMTVTADSFALGYIDHTTSGNLGYQYTVANETLMFIGSHASGVRSFTHNSTALEVVHQVEPSGNIYGIDVNWTGTDTVQVYVAADTYGVYVYSYNLTDGFTLETSQDDGGNYYDVYTDGTYVYCGCGDAGIRAYYWNGTALQLKDTHLKTEDSISYGEITGDGTRVYVEDRYGEIFAYSFDGTDLTFLDEIDCAGGTSSLSCNGAYIAVARDTYGVSMFSYGSNLSLLTTVDCGQCYNAFIDDEGYVWCANGDNFKVYQFSGTTLTLRHTQSGFSNTFGGTVNGSYYFAPTLLNGITLYEISGREDAGGGAGNTPVEGDPSGDESADPGSGASTTSQQYLLAFAGIFLILAFIVFGAKVTKHMGNKNTAVPIVSSFGLCGLGLSVVTGCLPLWFAFVFALAMVVIIYVNVRKG